MNPTDKESYEEEHKTSPVYTYLRIASTFGITMAANIYLLSYLLGGWLDDKFGTNILFRMILLFVALISAFMYLYKRVVISEKIEKEQKEAATKEYQEHSSLEQRMDALRKELDK